MRLIRYWFPLIVWVAVILAAASDGMSAERTGGWLRAILGRTPPPAVNFSLRKLAHLVEYAILALLAWRALRAELSVPGPRPALLIAVPMMLVAAVAITDEWLQGLRPLRSGSFWDVLLDLAGAVIALAVATRMSQRRGMTSPPSAR